MSERDDEPRRARSSALDRLIETIAPTWAERRAIARSNIRAIAASGRLSSENSQYSAGVDQEAHPDNDMIPDSGKQRRRCTLAYYNNPLCRGVVDSEVRQIIGSLHVQSRTGSKRADGIIEDEWKRLLDEEGLLETIQLCARHMLIDGGSVPNALGSVTDALELEVLPYRRIKTPFDKKDSVTIRDGFEYNEKGRIVAAHVEREESSYDAVYATGKTARVPLFDLQAHAALTRLSGQTKGLSWYAAAITRMEMVNRWMSALLNSAELHAYVVALVKTASKNADGFASGTSGVTLKPGQTSDGEQTKRVMEFARKHRFMYLPDGADYKLVQANAPQVAEFLVWCLRFIARAMGVSFERLTYDLTHTSYSSTKFGDRDDWITVQEHQAIVYRHILRPINRRVVQGLYLNPELGMPGGAAFAANPFAFTNNVHFQLPGRPPVDESKAEKANTDALKNRTASRTRITADRGDDASEILEEIMREDKEYIEARKQMYVDVGVAEDEALRLAIEEVNRHEGQPASDPEGEQFAREQKQQEAA